MANLITFAIGDIHGCFERLQDLMAVCDWAIDSWPTRFVFLGDYIDRGPDTKRVLDFLFERQLAERDRFLCLRGNHDDMLVRAARQSRTDGYLLNWWTNGGEQTLDSYGVSDPRHLPEEHLAWLGALPLQFADRHRLFVHAGVRPGVPLLAQADEDLLWIREPFLSSDEDHGALVIHGHTSIDSGHPDLRSNRLNLDTGACFGGPLTSAMFIDGERLPVLFLNSDGDIWQP